MTLDINQLRAAFLKKPTEGDGNANWQLFYPFYKMNFNDTAVWRFLPDADDQNPLVFIVENKSHKLTINGLDKKFACLKMYGDSCPCCERGWQYFSAGDKVMSKPFYRKIDYLAQGLVITSPFDYPVKPDENPVRLISLGFKLYGKIENSIVMGDMEHSPIDVNNGYDFRLTKLKQGDWGDYTSSEFARKSSAVPEQLAARVKLYDLKAYRFPSIEREAIETMIDAFLTGSSYEAEKTGPTVVPELKEGRPAAEVLQQAAAAQPQAPQAPAASTAPPGQPAALVGGQRLSPHDLLRKLKEQRQQAGTT